jgi:hypothetical protein
MRRGSGGIEVVCDNGAATRLRDVAHSALSRGPLSCIGFRPVSRWSEGASLGPRELLCCWGLIVLELNVRQRGCSQQTCAVELRVQVSVSTLSLVSTKITDNNERVPVLGSLLHGIHLI